MLVAAGAAHRPAGEKPGVGIEFGRRVAWEKHTVRPRGALKLADHVDGGAVWRQAHVARHAPTDARRPLVERAIQVEGGQPVAVGRPDLREAAAHKQARAIGRHRPNAANVRCERVEGTGLRVDRRQVLSGGAVHRVEDAADEQPAVNHRQRVNDRVTAAGHRRNMKPSDRQPSGRVKRGQVRDGNRLRVRLADRTVTHRGELAADPEDIAGLRERPHRAVHPPATRRHVRIVRVRRPRNRRRHQHHQRHRGHRRDAQSAAASHLLTFLPKHGFQGATWMLEA